MKITALYVNKMNFVSDENIIIQFFFKNFTEWQIAYWILVSLNRLLLSSFIGIIIS